VNDKDELTQLENFAQKLGFRVNYSVNLSWTHSLVHFYPSKTIIIGTKNYSEKSNIGYGFIPDKVKALILAHELGHIVVYKTLYPNMALADFCLSDDTEFKIRQEIYAWKTVINESSDKLELEFAQEAINEYVFCEFIGTCIIEESCISQQKIITKFARTETYTKV
jgi:hypothetical protein